MLTAIGLAFADRAGARLAVALGMPAGRDRLLRLVGALPDGVKARGTQIGPLMGEVRRLVRLRPVTEDDL